MAELRLRHAANPFALVVGDPRVFITIARQVSGEPGFAVLALAGLTPRNWAGIRCMNRTFLCRNPTIWEGNLKRITGLEDAESRAEG